MLAFLTSLTVAEIVKIIVALSGFGIAFFQWLGKRRINRQLDAVVMGLEKATRSMTSLMGSSSPVLQVGQVKYIKNAIKSEAEGVAVEKALYQRVKRIEGLVESSETAKSEES